MLHCPQCTIEQEQDAKDIAIAFLKNELNESRIESEEMQRLVSNCEKLQMQIAKMKPILRYIIGYGEGREFFPHEMDGSKNEVFEWAVELLSEIEPL